MTKMEQSDHWLHCLPVVCLIDDVAAVILFLSSAYNCRSH